MSVTKSPTANFPVPGSALDPWTEPDHLHADDGLFTSAVLSSDTDNDADGAWRGFDIVESGVSGDLTGVAVSLKAGLAGSYGNVFFYTDTYENYGFGVQVSLTITADEPAPVWSAPQRLPAGGPLRYPDTSHTAGGETDLWGLALQASDLTGDKFAVRLTSDNNIQSYYGEPPSMTAALGHLTVTAFGVVPLTVSGGGAVKCRSFARLAATVLAPALVWTDGPRAVNITASGFDIEGTLNRDGLMCSVVTGRDAFAPDADDVEYGAYYGYTEDSGYYFPRYGYNDAAEAGQSAQVTMTGTLEPETPYWDCYVTAAAYNPFDRIGPELIQATTSGGVSEPPPVLTRTGTRTGTRVTRGHTATRVTRQ